MTIGDIPNDEYNSLRQLSEYRSVKNMLMKIKDTTDPIFAFAYEMFANQSEVIFVERMNTEFNFKGYLIREVEYDLKTYLRSKTFDGLKALKSVSTNSGDHELIAILPQWGYQVHTYGLILLFRDNLRISWCWTPGDALDFNNVRLV